MKVFRRKSIIRLISLTLTVTFLQSTLGATISWALTSGPHQPEYMGYEEPGASDMVDLITGDFSFRVPVLNIPGPEGGFAMPLSYKGGIGLEQESSWVGLGWSLNPGAITRNVVEYPDDANGEPFQINRSFVNVETGVAMTAPGFGHVGWNSNVGHFGRFSILGLVGFSYGNGSITAGNVMGVDFSKGSVNADPVAIASAIITVATLGTGSAATTGANIAKNAFTQIAVETATTAMVNMTAPAMVKQHWQYNQGEKRNFLSKIYWIWLDEDSRAESMYGTLHLGNMPRMYLDIPTPKIEDAVGTPSTPVYVNDGQIIDGNTAASDMYYAYSGSSYIETINPTSIAKDNYSVSGPGISGGIEPYRIDIGSLSMPRQMNEDHIRLAMIPFRESFWPTGYKVQFKYKGSQSNAYYHHVGGTGTTDNYTFDLDILKFGIDHEVTSNDPSVNRTLTYGTSDPTLPEAYHYNSSGSVIEGNREGNLYGRLAQGKHVEWFTHNEILSDADNINFIDYYTPAERSNLLTEFSGSLETPILSGSSNTRIKVGANVVKYYHVDDVVTIKGQYLNGSVLEDFITNRVVSNVGTDYIDVTYSLPSNFRNGTISAVPIDLSNTTIGGFKVVREDGRAYYYALPVYEWSSITYFENVSDHTDNTSMSRIEPFPSTWLLTAITGADFVDRNNNNQVDEDDWGYWVKFNYGKFSSEYTWRTPYQGMTKTSDGNSYTYSKGKREQYYLNTIQTRTHSALFIKDLRLDGRSERIGTNTSKISSSLLLDEIVLLKNDDLDNLIASGLSTTVNTQHEGIMTNTDSFEQIYDKLDINSTVRGLIVQKAIKRIKFNYDYSLCKAAPNSFNTGPEITDIETTGKLTLKSLSIFGRNNMKVIPDFQFDYAYNPNYHKDDWDGWGYYNSSGSSSHTSHRASSSDYGASAWSMNKIISPIGHEILIDYERDSYSSISGYFIEN